ncbi:hypothetical protein AJ85_21600 [Alkalihalobacillus alcalophilus ATCC 27647 = CGMCC 1.3604]|uniref:Uncharacterized protein n=1 Tax=Alkalihalobacillus alcalophilus ATCC 27647 = CGMCC 1.3604 TaxID=1218173 RepID=A0A094YT23_ALKAL|nr:hypothetical protein [Alkalihalobacillus alcalophilus]KGA96632.1 hypothetical protein BALCAV_0215025 [Alkalihalobacillus alcalophilus ATCC 27647 = CGMCC 1.3604]MED1563620.1 hypothetical protein [Alkalihalobacillus alcalophilus]THG91984.1 hypothetical protein AJ85_21600 [Alkalihalobacillus alcalophilus ATCC 27647 = CGMCC 1.3604]
MNKKIGFLTVVVLMSMLFVGFPLQTTNVSAAKSEGTTISSQSRTVTVNRSFSLNATVPQTIPYNDGRGWSGTLSLIGQQSTGDYILATYTFLLGLVSYEANVIRLSM